MKVYRIKNCRVVCGNARTAARYRGAGVGEAKCTCAGQKLPSNVDAARQRELAGIASQRNDTAVDGFQLDGCTDAIDVQDLCVGQGTDRDLLIYSDGLVSGNVHDHLVGDGFGIVRHDADIPMRRVGPVAGPTYPIRYRYRCAEYLQSAGRHDSRELTHFSHLGGG